MGCGNADGNRWLICVRYRYDPASRRRVTTVKLIVDEAPWKPPVSPESSGCRLAEVEAAVVVRVNYGETSLREKVKAAGGYWNAKRRLWVLPLYRVRELGLEKRIA
jgi:hypothetical protein